MRLDLPCKWANPFIGTRDVPVTNCKSRALSSLSNVLTAYMFATHKANTSTLVSSCHRRTCYWPLKKARGLGVTSKTLSNNWVELQPDTNVWELFTGETPFRKRNLASMQQGSSPPGTCVSKREIWIQQVLWHTFSHLNGKELEQLVGAKTSALNHTHLPKPDNNLIIFMVSATVACVPLPVVDVNLIDTTHQQLKLTLVENLVQGERDEFLKAL